MDSVTPLFSLSFIALSAGLTMLAWNWRRERSQRNLENQASPEPLDLTEDLEITSREAIEQRVKNAFADVKELILMGQVSDGEKNRIKAHQENFYARYYAANIFRSQSSFTRYQEELDLAEKELSAIEKLVKKHQSKGDRFSPRIVSDLAR